MSNPLRALIVEDSADDALLIARQLSQGGYELIYEQVQTAVSMADALKQHWDIIICDHFMPQFDSLAALKIARGKSPQTPFIIVSGRLHNGAIQEIMSCGASDYVSKDDIARLLPVIERELKSVQVCRSVKQP